MGTQDESCSEWARRLIAAADAEGNRGDLTESALRKWCEDMKKPEHEGPEFGFPGTRWIEYYGVGFAVWDEDILYFGDDRSSSCSTD